jgi:hypothetical protein
MFSQQYIDIMHFMPAYAAMNRQDIDSAWEDMRESYTISALRDNLEQNLLALAGCCFNDLSQRYKKEPHELVKELVTLHLKKSAGYVGNNPDPWSNFRKVNEFNISVAEGIITRMCDKYSRYLVLRKDPTQDKVGETIEDTIKDLLAYSCILLCILGE